LNARSRLPPPGPLPDSHALRARALAASWRRDRTVHRRRLAWRWTQWAFVRYGLPALVAAAALVLSVSQVMQWLDAPSRTPAPAASTAPAPVPPADATAAPPPTTASPAAAIASAPSSDADAPASLRLETRLGPAAVRPAQPTATSGPPDPDFRLQPDDYLHSKEP
jgi:hypothetical protein